VFVIPPKEIVKYSGIAECRLTYRFINVYILDTVYHVQLIINKHGHIYPVIYELFNNYFIRLDRSYMVGGVVNNEFEMVWKERIIAKFDALSYHLSEIMALET
jgi:hypothetical protein